MSDYMLSNSDITRTRITAQRARELYEQAAAQPNADLDGDLEHGFHYWSIGSDGRRLVRHHVMPLPDDEQPASHPSHENP